MRALQRSTHRLFIVCTLLLCSPALAESICWNETSAQEHFDSLRANFAFVDDGQIRLDVNIWGVKESVEVQVQIYYGVAGDPVLNPELDEGFELVAELATNRDNDNLSSEVHLKPDFSRILIHVDSAFHRDGISSCGLTHTKFIDRDDVPDDKPRGNLGPFHLVK